MGKTCSFSGRSRLQIALEGEPVEIVSLRVNGEAQLGLAVTEPTAAAPSESAELGLQSNGTEISPPGSVDHKDGDMSQRD